MPLAPVLPHLSYVSPESELSRRRRFLYAQRCTDEICDQSVMERRGGG